MRRIKLVLAVAAAMVALLTAASPAYAVDDVSINQLDPGNLVGLGIQTRDLADDKALGATREAAEAANPPSIAPQILPGLGENTALSGPPLPRA